MADKTALTRVGWFFAGVTTAALLIAALSVVNQINLNQMAAVEKSDPVFTASVPVAAPQTASASVALPVSVRSGMRAD